MEKVLKNRKGITLIALVITIIVLLILAGVSISMISSQDGILGKATKAKLLYDEKALEEKVLLAVQSAEIDSNGANEISMNDLKENLKKIGLDITDDNFFENQDNYYYKISEDKAYEISKKGNVNVVSVSDIEEDVDFKAYLNGNVKITCVNQEMSTGNLRTKKFADISLIKSDLNRNLAWFVLKGLTCKDKESSSLDSSCSIENAQTKLSLLSTGNLYSGEGMELVKANKRKGSNVISKWVAADSGDYYKGTFYLNVDWENGGEVYLADIKINDENKEKPVSSSIWINLVPTDNKGFEYIFKVNGAENSNRENIIKEGYIVEDVNGNWSPFIPYSRENFVKYDEDTGKISLSNNSLRITRLNMPTNSLSRMPAASNTGEDVKFDLYMWVEVASENFGWNLNNGSITDVELVFAGIPIE